MARAKPAGSPGYTFPLLLIIVAVMGIGASRLDLEASYRLRRDKEEELLFRGRAYMRAIRQFQMQNRRYPTNLKELSGSRDQRSYIRQLYKDPMTGEDFTLIYTPERQIAGVASASMAPPFRRTDFESELQDFEKAKTYADWKFQADKFAKQTSEAEAAPPVPFMVPF